MRDLFVRRHEALQHGRLTLRRSHHRRSIVDILASRASTNGEGLAYTFLASGEHEVDRLTWAELDRRSRAAAAAIASRVASRSRVLLLFPPGLDFVPAFFGCLGAGAIAVPVYPPSGHEPTGPAPGCAG